MLEQEGCTVEIVTLRFARLRQALVWPPLSQDARGNVLMLSDAAWNRGALGFLANELANAHPQRAHAVFKL